MWSKRERVGETARLLGVSVRRSRGSFKRRLRHARRATLSRPADVTPDLTAPELHVIALAQTAATDDGMLATVLSVVLARRGRKDPGDVLQPLKTNELTAQYQTLAGTAFKGTGVVAVFPLGALVPDTEIRVVFDRTTRGFSGLSMCRECPVPVNLNRLR